jgi:cation:H+ antiporter
MGVDTQIVAITFVAVGTSLPELVTSITALRKKNSDIGVGNIIGANIINSTLLIGLCGTISGGNLAIDWITRYVACAVMLAITLVLIIPAAVKNKTYRWQGIVMLALYFGYMAYNIIYVTR